MTPSLSSIRFVPSVKNSEFQLFETPAYNDEKIRSIRIAGVRSSDMNLKIMSLRIGGSAELIARVAGVGHYGLVPGSLVRLLAQPLMLSPNQAFIAVEDNGDLDNTVIELIGWVDRTPISYNEVKPTQVPAESTVQKYLLDYVHNQLDALVASPSGWGDPFSVENLYLQALDFREQIRWLDQYEKQGKESSRYWSGVLKDHGYIPNVPLSNQLEQQSDDEVFAVLMKLLPKLRAAY